MCISAIAVIKQRIFDIAKQELDTSLHNSVKCFNYQYMVSNLCIQSYLNKPIPNKYKTWICKFRLSSHNLAVEKGRFYGIERCNRKCFHCNNDIEDEMHFILKCPIYNG